MSKKPFLFLVFLFIGCVSYFLYYFSVEASSITLKFDSDFEPSLHNESGPIYKEQGLLFTPKTLRPTSTPIPIPPPPKENSLNFMVFSSILLLIVIILGLFMNFGKLPKSQS